MWIVAAPCLGLDEVEPVAATIDEDDPGPMSARVNTSAITSSGSWISAAVHHRLLAFGPGLALKIPRHRSTNDFTGALDVSGA
ncbi:hypothetical protein [Streptomyces sp. NPDC002690]